jgi:hypothetical protein
VKQEAADELVDVERHDLLAPLGWKKPKCSARIGLCSINAQRLGRWSLINRTYPAQRVRSFILRGQSNRNTTLVVIA